MTEQKMTHPTAATVGWVEMGAGLDRATTSTRNDTTSPPRGQPFRIADLLHHGAENAIPRRELVALAGCRDRDLRRLIQAERRQGIPILSDCVGGYYLPGDQAERDRCVRSLRRRASEIMETAAAIEEAEV